MWCLRTNPCESVEASRYVTPSTVPLCGAPDGSGHAPRAAPRSDTARTMTPRSSARPPRLCRRRANRRWRPCRRRRTARAACVWPAAPRDPARARRLHRACGWPSACSPTPYTSSPIRQAPASDMRIGIARRRTGFRIDGPESGWPRSGSVHWRKICPCAVVAQLVERELPKLEVAGSSRPVRRFSLRRRRRPGRSPRRR